MSKKKEFAKKFLGIGRESIEKSIEIDVLDEILHPEYYQEQYFTAEDRLWMNSSSWLSFLVERKPLTFRSTKPDGREFRPQAGIEAAKKRRGSGQDAEFRTPKWNLLIHNITEDGDIVTVTYIASFMHDSPYYGIKPTNQKIEVNGVHIFTFHQDKIIKIIWMIDTHQVLVQMGDVILRKGDEEQIQQYMAMLKRQNLIP